ncbi:uncharacterized protein LOC144167778 [Haemaphysalis longicornis]
MGKITRAPAMPGRLRSILVLLVAAYCRPAAAAADGYCGKKTGVVKQSRSASVGANFLARCGRTLVLKYSVDSATFYMILQKFCLVTHLCYEAGDQYRDNPSLFQEKLLQCYRVYAMAVTRMRPDLVGEELTANAENITAEIAGCIKTGIPMDKEVMLGVVRYVRLLFFAA